MTFVRCVRRERNTSGLNMGKHVLPSAGVALWNVLTVFLLYLVVIVTLCNLLSALPLEFNVCGCWVISAVKISAIVSGT